MSENILKFKKQRFFITFLSVKQFIKTMNCENKNLICYYISAKHSIFGRFFQKGQPFISQN